MVNVKVTNFQNFAYTFVAKDTTPFEVKFVNNAGNVVEGLSVVANNATFTESNGVYTFTPGKEGRVDILAVKAYPTAE